MLHKPTTILLMNEVDASSFCDLSEDLDLIIGFVFLSVLSEVKRDQINFPKL